MKVGRPFFYAIFIVLFGFGCKKKSDEPVSSFLLFPAGRSFLNTSEIKVLINDVTYPSDTVFDGCGGYWLKIQKAELPKSGRVCIQYIRKRGELSLFKQIGEDKGKWINESSFIDCNNEVLKTKAFEITKDYQNDIEKARQIHQFVIAHVKLQIYQNAFLDKASRTYELGYGTCMNFSRLFIALCRAVNIPARSVWGIVYDHDGNNIYDYHHQWAEVLDENGYWHQADFNYSTVFDLNDIRYLDLIYAAEENTIIINRLSEEIKAGKISFFNNYPVALTGKLGFLLTENKSPDYMTVQYIYEF
jgi:hypothetical protein